MKILLSAALTLCAGSAAALDTALAVSTAPAPALEQAASTEPARPRFVPPAEARLAARNLALLAARGGEIPQERLAALLPQLAKFNSDLEAALGKDLLAAAAEEEARDGLRRIRTALQLYYADTGGKYPADPAALVPGYLPAVPELRLGGHALTGKVTVIGSKRYDDDPAKAVTDSGGWLYFSAEDSANRGLLVLDCSHKDPAGVEYFKY